MTSQSCSAEFTLRLYKPQAHKHGNVLWVSQDRYVYENVKGSFNSSVKNITSKRTTKTDPWYFIIDYKKLTVKWINR